MAENQSGRPKANSSTSSKSANENKLSSAASKKAQIVASATETANIANKAKKANSSKENSLFSEPASNAEPVKENVTPTQDAKPMPQDSNEGPAQKDIEPAQDDILSTDSDIDELDSLDGAGEIAGGQEKKKRKKKGAVLAEPGEEGELASKKKKKKRKLLWLLLLLLLLLIVLVVVFRDVLFPPKPIVVVPQGMILDIQETGQDSTLGTPEFIFRPGDDIIFKDSIQVGSARYEEYEDGTRKELSPFTLRLRFEIKPADENSPLMAEDNSALIESVKYNKDDQFTLFNGWYYLNDIIIPGETYKKVIDSLHLSSEKIGNKWQGAEVKLVLEYQIICPESEEAIEVGFDYEYPPEWAYNVVAIYNDLKS